MIDTKVIEQIKNKITEQDVVDREELDEIKKLKRESVNNSIALAKLFLRCYDALKDNFDELKDELKDIDPTNLRIDIEEFGKEDYGAYYLEKRIALCINSNHESIKKVISLFFQVFGEEL